MVPTPARCVGIYWSTNRTWNCGCALDTFTGSDVDLRHRGIPLSHFLTAIIRYPNKARYVKPLILWAALSFALALAVLIARPWLIWFGAFYLIALSLNIALARNKLERSLANDVIFIVECVALDADHVGDRIWHGALAPTASNLSPHPRASGLQPSWPSSYSSTRLSTSNHSFANATIRVTERHRGCGRSFP